MKSYAKLKTSTFITGIVILIIFTSLFFVPELYAESSEKTQVCNADECRSLLAEYYMRGTIGDENLTVLIEGINSLTDSLDRILSQDKNTRNTKQQNELLIAYLEHAVILSTAYGYGSLNNNTSLIKKIDSDITRFLQLSDLESEVYVKYADYLETKLSRPETKRFNTKLTLPVLYRKALLKDKTNKAAFVKLSCWQISSADELTSNFNSQIKATEQFIETLHEVDKFNAYIRYSLFYMKIYNTKKGWEYFYKAKNLFPSHPLIAKLYENYHKGRFKTGT